MANTILTIDMITKEALRVLHQELKLVPKVRRDYDDRFARSGAKIGDTLRIRKPAKYTVTSGATLSIQDSTEQYASLPVTTQKHVGMAFSSAEMALDIDSYSRQFIRPAMAQLAASVESDFATYMKNQIFWAVGDTAANLSTLRDPLLARQRLSDQLAPMSPRNFVLNNLSSATLVDGLKGLFQSSSQIKEQYEEGMMGRSAGFDFYESSILPTHTNGTAAVTAGDINGAGQTGSTLAVDQFAAGATITAGTVFTIAGVNAVHPETKADLGYLQQFVVTAAATADGGGAIAALPISPAIVTTGAFQNVTAAGADNATITILGTAAGTYANNFAFHPDAFAFATADLDLPPNVEASRQNMDGLSLRVLRAYDVTEDQSILRVDVLYGYCALYPQLAAKVVASSSYVS